MKIFYDKLIAILQSEYADVRREKFVAAHGQGGLEHDAMFYEKSSDKNWKLDCVWFEKRKKGLQVMKIGYYSSL